MNRILGAAQAKKTKAFLFAFLVATPLAAATELRPKERPANLLPVTDVQTLDFAPKPRPDKLILAMGKRPKKTASGGGICGVAGIGGTSVAPIKGRLKGCGIAAPVRLTSVAGVALSTPALVDCNTARALNSWVTQKVQKAFRKEGGVTRLQVAASYSCRSRNNRPGAKLSEHSFGHAIDISGFTLGNGQRVTVLNDWRKRPHSKSLRAVHKGACGIFGTVLGPESDRFHQDHFHFDTARYRSGAYCR